MIRFFRGGVVFLGVMFASIIIFSAYQNQKRPGQIEEKYRGLREKQKNKHAMELHNLEKKYQTLIWQSRGKTVFDRVYNQPDQSISGLIESLSKEIFPENWRCEVETEEFVYFILLVQVPSSQFEISDNDLIMRTKSLLAYTDPYLRSVAYFDRNRKCFLFLDGDALGSLQQLGSLSPPQLKLAQQRGRNFQRFNSLTLAGETQQGHLLFPVEVVGGKDRVLYTGLLDTGASMTVLTKKMASSTGLNDFLTAPKRKFQTANGQIYAPVVKRTIRIGQFEKSLEVAVSDEAGVCLIGMNLFDDYHFVIDSTTSSVHLWNKD